MTRSMGPVAGPPSVPQLSLDLPASRMTLDFSSIAKQFTLATDETSAGSRASCGANQFHSCPCCSTRPNEQIKRKPLPVVREESTENTLDRTDSRSNSFSWFRISNSGATSQLTRTLSNSSTSTANSSFSSANFNSQRSTPISSRSVSRANSFVAEKQHHLTSLPPSVLHHVLSYALDLPLTVSIGPPDANRHMQHRYHRDGLKYVDLRQLMNHPLFLVSRHIRKATLETVHTRCQFVIDLNSIYHSPVSSTIHDNMKNHNRFWTLSTPRMVTRTLQYLSKLHLRLPVPSCEETVHRSRDETDWMDGSDGRGGGGYRVRSMKKEEEDAREIQRYLRAIVELIMAPRENNNIQASKLNRSSSTTSRIRRITSLRSQKSRSVPVFRSKSPLNPSYNEDEDSIRSLKRLEIVLVKRSHAVQVLQETINLVQALKAMPVMGFTRYFFELEGTQSLWATKRREKWIDWKSRAEPNGAKLLEDLQRITLARYKYTEPLHSPTEFKYVKVDKKSRQLNLPESAIRQSAIVLEKHPELRSPHPPLPKALPPHQGYEFFYNPKAASLTTRKPTPQITSNEEILHRRRKRVDSFQLIMEEGMAKVGSVGTTAGPPSMDDIKKIVAELKDEENRL